MAAVRPVLDLVRDRYGHPRGVKTLAAGRLRVCCARSCSSRSETKSYHPHHGAAVIEKRETKVAFGEKREYLVLRLAYGDLILNVPADNTEGVGLREVINDEEVEEVFAVLRKKEARMPTNWSRRYKNHSEKLRSGDIYQVAEVVRNLSIRDKDKGLSAGREVRMLQRGPSDSGLRADLRPQRGRRDGRRVRTTP